MSCQRCHSWICKCPPPIIVENTELINQQAQRIAELEFDNANLKAVIDRLHLDYKELEQQRDELLAAAIEFMVATAFSATCSADEFVPAMIRYGEAENALNLAIAKVKP